MALNAELAKFTSDGTVLKLMLQPAGEREAAADAAVLLRRLGARDPRRRSLGRARRARAIAAS